MKSYKLENLVIGGSKHQVLTMLWIEYRHIMWMLFRDRGDTTFILKCYIDNFNFKKWHKIFWFGRFVFESYYQREKQIKENKII
jgi:hypothetical protein